MTNNWFTTPYTVRYKLFGMPTTTHHFETKLDADHFCSWLTETYKGKRGNPTNAIPYTLLCEGKQVGSWLS